MKIFQGSKGHCLRKSKSFPEECQVQAFFSLIVCADYVGMGVSVKEMKRKREQLACLDYMIAKVESVGEK